MTDLKAVTELIVRTVPHIVDEVLKRIPVPADGADGAPGPAGADGAPGPAGAAGADGAPGPAGADGKDGRGIVALDIRDGSLHVLYSDGTDQMVGRVVGDVGAAGKDTDPTVVAALVYQMMNDFREETKRLLESRIIGLERLVAHQADQIKSLTDADRELDTLSRDFIKGLLTDA